MFLTEQIIYIKMDLALNNLQKLIRHKTQQTKPNHIAHSCFRVTKIEHKNIIKRSEKLQDEIETF